MTAGPTDTNQDLSTFVVREFQSAVPRAITWWPPDNYCVPLHRNSRFQISRMGEEMGWRGSGGMLS